MSHNDFICPQQSSVDHYKREEQTCNRMYAKPRLLMSSKCKCKYADVLYADIFAVLRSEIHLHEAARKNSVDKVKKLISDKVDVNSRNNVSICSLFFSLLAK